MPRQSVAGNGRDGDALAILETCHQFQFTAQSPDIGDLGGKVDVLPFFDLGDVGAFPSKSNVVLLQYLLRTIAGSY